MSQLHQLLHKSSTSSFYRWVLNSVLGRVIPFNQPHGLTIIAIQPGSTTIKLPFKRKNLNHVKGIHACALATLCEYTVGMTLMGMISEKEYRIILKSLKLDYHYQAKMDVTASFKIEKDLLVNDILDPLQNTNAVFHEFIVEVHDKNKNLICTGYVNWQIKKWSHVKSK